MENTEQLAMNHLSVDEVAARRSELRKMRELMFRAEVKAKRVSKIKSKTYRRIKKREREKLAAKLDVDAGDEDDEEGQLKREVDRARERATLRHKNTGKWAKAMKAKGELDVDERRDISEMLERGEQLRRKIRGHKGSDEEDELSDYHEEDEGSDDLSKIKTSAFEELKKINVDGDGLLEDAASKSNGIFEMKFMKDAMARSRQQTNQMVNDFVEEIGDAEEDGSEYGIGETREASSSGPAVQRSGGRAIYQPAPSVRLSSN